MRQPVHGTPTGLADTFAAGNAEIFPGTSGKAHVPGGNICRGCPPRLCHRLSARPRERCSANGDAATSFAPRCAARQSCRPALRATWVAGPVGQAFPRRRGTTGFTAGLLPR
jgi:hypothetical protein